MERDRFWNDADEELEGSLPGENEDDEDTDEEAEADESR